MNIRKITSDKKQFLSLLLLADEQESMIDRYIDRGEMFVLDDGGTKAVAVVTDEGNGCCELKNMAVAPECHRQGYGKALLSFQRKIPSNHCRYGRNTATPGILRTLRIYVFSSGRKFFHPTLRPPDHR